MNASERALLGRLYTVLDRMTSYPPSNPADIKRHVKASNVLKHQGHAAAIALSQIGFRDYTDAADTLAKLERDLEIGGAS